MLQVEVIVQGRISNLWSEWFENLTLSYPQEDQTALTGTVEDQAALHGLLSRMWDLGLPLISIRTGVEPVPAAHIHINVRAVIERETPRGREIIIQVRDKPHEGGQWFELPGGRVEPFESLVKALFREVEEETGLEWIDVKWTNQRIETAGVNSNVECFAPFAVYQTLYGPVDSMGVYFRCWGHGEPRPTGDDTRCVQWILVDQVADWLREDTLANLPDAKQRFSWVDRAGLTFYLHNYLSQSV